MQQIYIEFCRVLKTRGLKGEIKVLPYEDTPASLLDLAFLHIEIGPQQFVRHNILKSNVKGAAAFLTLEGITSIEQAQQLIGKELFLERSQLPELAEGEFLPRDLLELEVRTMEDLLLGVVRDLMKVPQGMLLVLQLADPDPDRKNDEALIPLRPEFVRKVDLEAGRIRVDLPAGLI